MPSYNPGTPQGPDIPADSQDEFLTNFDLLNQFMSVDHVQFGNIVTFATNANPCVCTSPNHGLTTGNSVSITHFGSLVGDVITPWNINGGPYTATVIDANTFSINANASGNPPYLANTGAFSSPSINYGFHKKTFFPAVLSQGPNTVPPLGNPYSAYYTKAQSDIAQLFFQNSPGSGFERQLTDLPFIEVSNANGKGIITPWGIRINFGQITYKITTQAYNLPAPFVSSFWSVIGSLQIKTIPKGHRPQWSLTPVGLTQFNAIERTQDPIESLNNVPGWYFAIGV